MTKKPKPCHQQGCDKPRYNVLRLCYTHYLERKKQKKEETKAKRLARKLASKGYEKSELKRWKAKCWKLVSEYVRRKDADEFGMVTCYSCPVRLHWKEMDCGHHFHSKLDYDLRNLRPQETRCNRFLHGNLGVYAKRLIEENGLEWYQKLELDANTKPPHTLDELKKIHADLQEKLSKI